MGHSGSKEKLVEASGEAQTCGVSNACANIHTSNGGSTAIGYSAVADDTIADDESNDYDEEAERNAVSKARMLFASGNGSFRSKNY